MLIKKPLGIPSSDITPERLYLRRREFLQTVAATAAAAAFGGLRAEAAAVVSQPRQALTVTKQMVTTTDAVTAYDAITTYNNFYEFGTDKEDPSDMAGDFHPQPWSVDVDGECAKPGHLTLEDILRPHPLEERVYRMRCVEGWSMIIPWVGFPLGDLLKRFEPNGNAQFVQFTTIMRPKELAGQRERFPSVLPWPYKEGLRMDEAMHPLTLIAVGLYGQTLLNQNGAPLRLVVPWKYGFKGIKSIVRISFVKKQPLTTWQNESPTEYGFYSDVNPNVSRVHYNQAKERRIGEFLKRDTLMFNGYGDQVASMYAGMDLRRLY